MRWSKRGDYQGNGVNMAAKSSKKGKIKQSDSTKRKSVAQSVVSGEVHKEYAAELNKTSLIEARELQKQDGLKKDNTNTFKERGQLTGSRRKPFLPALLEPASKLLGAAFGVALLLVLAYISPDENDEEEKPKGHKSKASTA